MASSAAVPVLAIEHPLRANLPRLALGKAQSFDFSLDLGLRGTESLSLVPVAGDTKVDLRSTWPHPSFQGRFLPDPQQQYIGSDGFHAQWHVTALASHAREQLLYTKDGSPPSARIAALESLDLRFVEPINIYSQSDRAIKYGFLFVALLFGAFFLFEVLKRLPIHPAQYLLVGLALAIFFLLLLSLSEHIAFAQAYLAAASASTGLLGFYLSFVLRSWRRGHGVRRPDGGALWRPLRPARLGRQRPGDGIGPALRPARRCDVEHPQLRLVPVGAAGREGGGGRLTIERRPVGGPAAPSIRAASRNAGHGGPRQLFLGGNCGKSDDRPNRCLSERRKVRDDRFRRHPVGQAGEDGANGHPRAGDDRLPATYPFVTRNVCPTI